MILSKDQILVSCSHMTCYLQKNTLHINLYKLLIIYFKPFSNIQK